MKSIGVILTIFYFIHKHQILCAQNQPYKHYARHPPISDTTYDNQTLTGTNDDGNMCQLSVRCPNAPLLCKKID